MCSFVKSPSLSEIIADEIAQLGPMPFARFMALALYHPELGYYTSGQAAIGRKGDFYTNVSVGPAFGQVLASQLTEMWERLGSPGEFVLVEQGAHDGQLAADILTQAEEPFASALRYHIVEPSPNLQQRQEEKLASFADKVAWFRDLESLPQFRGVHLSNELIDALPFHLVQSQGEAGWRELLVSNDEGGFAFTTGELSPALGEVSQPLPVRPEGYLLELRPQGAHWLAGVEARLDAGFVLIVDYGYSREQIRAPHRSRGTFACFRQHRRDENLLETPGEKDITSHVDFTDLAEAAAGLGLVWEGFADQNHFMVGAGEPLLKSLEGRTHEPEARKTLRAMQTLLHPESMGTQFHYLAFSKNAGGPILRGFRYGRNAETLRA